jgi:hypothetical protein
MAHTVTLDSGILILLEQDSNLNLRGVRGLRIDRITGESWSLVSAGEASVKWARFGRDPWNDFGDLVKKGEGKVPPLGRGIFELIPVQDSSERGLRHMLVDTRSGSTWWHETIEGKEHWVPIDVVE